MVLSLGLDLLLNSKQGLSLILGVNPILVLRLNVALILNVSLGLSLPAGLILNLISILISFWLQLTQFEFELTQFIFYFDSEVLTRFDSWESN